MTRKARLISVGLAALLVALLVVFFPIKGISISIDGQISIDMNFAYASPDTETLRPNAAGDECNIRYQTSQACPNHYLEVDEVVADDATTEVWDGNSDNYYRDLYNIADHSVGSGTINFIKVYARCIAWTGIGDVNQASLKIAIKSGTGSGSPDTVSESAPITLTKGVWTLESNQWNTNPATSATWTWDEIDKLQAGIALRSWSSIYGRLSDCTQVYVDVDYTAGGAPEITVDPLSKAFGILDVNTTSSTAIDYFTITNTGTGAVDVTIQGTDLTGGDDTWDLDDTGTPGENIYGLYAGLDDDDDNFDVVVKESSANTLLTDLAEDGTQDFGLKLYMPTSVTDYDGQQMTATVTLVASVAE